MKQILIFLTLSFLISAQINAQHEVTPTFKYSNKEINLGITNYKMDIKIDYEQEKLFSECTITIKNISDKEVENIPVLLYRLMKVYSVKDGNNKVLQFKQQVESFEDWEVYQANFIEIQLPEPFLPGEIQNITINYGGHLLGYTETGMSYIKDKISPEFTIIRDDCNAYPILGYPNDDVTFSAIRPDFNYNVSITVLDSVVVANGGRLTNKTIKDGKATYKYENIKPAWRIDIAIAKYQIKEKGNFKVFYFPEDSIGASKVVKTFERTMELYTKWWGNLVDFEGFSVIEIPIGWGSQADVSSIIQSANAFKKAKKLDQLYHEISHLWNVKSTEKYPPRWNEGLASFLQYLTEKELNSINRLDATEGWITKNITEKEVYKKVAFKDFGKEKVTELSYRTGFLMFYVLHELIGEQEFNQIIKTFYKKYQKTGANTEEFFALANKLSGQNLNVFFQDWFYTTKYVDLILQGYKVKNFVNHYRKLK